MAHSNDTILQRKNLARFFVEHRPIALILLVANLLWGCYSYYSMPQRKDPYIPMRRSLVTVTWPGASAQQVQDLVSKPIEEAVARSNTVERIESVSRPGVSYVYVFLDEYTNTDMDRAFDDVKIKLDQVQDLPPGAGPIQYEKDLGDTAALTMSVASPKDSDVDVTLRADQIENAIDTLRQGTGRGVDPKGFTLVYCLPYELNPAQTPIRVLAQRLEAQGAARDLRVVQGTGYVGIDGQSDLPDSELLGIASGILEDDLQLSSIDPDAWEPVIIRDPSRTREQLESVAGNEYSYRQLDDYSDLIARTLQYVGSVSKVTRYGVLPQTVNLNYSQTRFAALGLSPGMLPKALNGANVAAGGGSLNVGGSRVGIDAPACLQNVSDIGNVAVTSTTSGDPVRLRDIVDIEHGYQDPPLALDYYIDQDSQGNWQRHRSVTLAVYMRPDSNIEGMGRDVDSALSSLKTRLPADLIVGRISDQPQQVRESVGLFLESLWQAVVLVVLVSLVGFRDWRSALLMACAIPLTLAMAVGLMEAAGLDLQQVSIASLIIALGLLVDDPVVAGDAIKRELNAGRSASIAAWLGPTRLGTAIAFATITNVVAYLPFLLLKGDTGRFLYALPVTMTCALVSSRIVSMTFVPFLGYHLLRGKSETEQPEHFRQQYRKVVSWCIEHRKPATACSLLFLLLGGLLFLQIKQSFFPYDSQYLSYIEIELPQNASLSATDRVTERAEEIVEAVTARYGEDQGKPDHPKRILTSIASFVGSGPPRFWFTVFPQEPHANYAMIVMQVADKSDTIKLKSLLQNALSTGIPGARLDVHQLETGRPIGIPVAVRISGDDPVVLREIADDVEGIYNGIPIAVRVRDDWGSAALNFTIHADPARAAHYGVTDEDIAASYASGYSGQPVGVLREGDKEIPIVARLQLNERTNAGDIGNLYVFSSQTGRAVPMESVATLEPAMEPMVLRRRNQFDCITVSCFPTDGHLPSDVVSSAQSQLKQLEASLPAGYHIDQGGEAEEQSKAFLQLVSVLIVSVICIYLALAFEFKHVIKPLVVFATVPFGIIGAVIGLTVMNQPFGFMAFLGFISLVGVLVSHIIVLFDFIETARARGDELEKALLDAGVQRLRPILITVGATVFAFVPLAIHGGPLWQPLCYAQIGGLTVGAFSTLLLVPMLYAMFVKDWKIIKWEKDV